MKVLALLGRHSEGARVGLLASALGSGILSAAVVAVCNKAIASDFHGSSWALPVVFLLVLGSMWLTRRMAARRFIALFESIQQDLRETLAERLRTTPLRTLETLDERLERATGDLAFLSTTVEAWVSGIAHLAFLVGITLLAAALSIKAFLLWCVTLGLTAGWLAPRIRQMNENLRNLGRDNGALGQKILRIVDGIKQVKLDSALAVSLVKDLNGAANDLYARQSRIEATSARAFAGAILLLLLGMGAATFVDPDRLGLEQNDAYELVTFFQLAWAPLFGVVTSLPQFMRAEAAANSLLDVIDELHPEAGTAGQAREEPSDAFETLGLRDAQFVYGSGDPKSKSGFAVGPVTLSIRRGELALLTGGNGSGKTTLMKMLLGLYPLQSGHLEVDGRRLRQDEITSWRARFTAVMTEPHLFDRLYGLENVPPERLSALLRRLGINDLVRHADGTFARLDLSTGQQMRLALVIALLEDRPVLLLDEWTAHQDPEMTEWYFDKLLPELLAAGKMVFAVTHDERFFDRADHLIRLDRGLVVIDRRQTSRAHAERQPSPPA